MENNLKELIGKKVIYSKSGGAAGSILRIEFEDKSYFFLWCAWRIELGANKVIVTSEDTTEVPGGLIQEKTPIFENNRVLKIDLKAHYDLDILFENDYRLRVFCNIGHSRNDYDINWEFLVPNKNLAFTVNNHYKIIETAYDA